MYVLCKFLSSLTSLCRQPLVLETVQGSGMHTMVNMLYGVYILIVYKTDVYVLCIMVCVECVTSFLSGIVILIKFLNSFISNDYCVCTFLS